MMETKKASPSEEGNRRRGGKKEEKKREEKKMEMRKDANAAAVTKKVESMHSLQSSHRLTRKSMPLDAQKANKPPAEQLRSIQASPE